MTEEIEGAGDAVTVDAAAVGQETFAGHYEILSDALRTLREQKVADIDALVPLVDKAMASYKFCRGRIDAVRKILDSKMDGERAED